MRPTSGRLSCSPAWAPRSTHARQACSRRSRRSEKVRKGTMDDRDSVIACTSPSSRSRAAMRAADRTNSGRPARSASSRSTSAQVDSSCSTFCPKAVWRAASSCCTSRMREVQQELAALQTAFGQNVLHDESTWALVLREEADLAGLPEFVRSAARMAARERELGDVHAITLSRSSIVPFLTFSERRDLREQAWRAWVERGAHAGEHDNRPLVGRILQLRRELAQLHGYATYADYALVDRMARTPQAVDRLLDDVWERAKAALAREQ